MNKQELEEKYICPFCIKKGWKSPVVVEVINEADGTWHWRCTNRRCNASDDWQVAQEPMLRREYRPKLGFER